MFRSICQVSISKKETGSDVLDMLRKAEELHTTCKSSHLRDGGDGVNAGYQNRLPMNLPHGPIGTHGVVDGMG